MADLDKDGKVAKAKPPVEPVPPTSSKTTTKAIEPPAQVKNGFQYTRGNYDTSVITLLATINANIVKLTEILTKDKTDGGSGK